MKLPIIRPARPNIKFKDKEPRLKDLPQNPIGKYDKQHDFFRRSNATFKRDKKHPCSERGHNLIFRRMSRYGVCSKCGHSELT